MAWGSEFNSFPSVILLPLVDETYTFVFGGVASPSHTQGEKSSFRAANTLAADGGRHRSGFPVLPPSCSTEETRHSRPWITRSPPNKDPPSQAGRSPHQAWVSPDAKLLAFLLDFYKGSPQGAISGQRFQPIRC